jgi:hypothetical protein
MSDEMLLLLLGLGLLGVGMCVAWLISGIAARIRRRRDCSPPVTFGSVELYDGLGEEYHISAKLPIRGLERLVRGVNRRDFG